MTKHTSPRNPRALRTCVTGVIGALVVAGCSAGDIGGGGDDGDGVTISFLVGNAQDDVAAAEQVAEDFMAENEGIIVDVETRPAGGEGDNIVKTRLATETMNDVFVYNTGSLFQALDPAQNMVPLTGEGWLADVDESFLPTVSAGEEVYGAPFGTAMGGGVLYNTRVYEELGLEVPMTWEDFMANNAAIDDAGLDPVIQTYQETWTSQLFVLGDFHNVAAAEPDFAEQYTANQAKYASSPAAIRGFEHLQEVHDAGYLNDDFASAGLEDGLRKVASGEGVHYPLLTAPIGTIYTVAPDQADDVGFFALPGDDASTNGLTYWTPAGLYIPTTTEGEELEAARALIAYAASPAGCNSFTEGYAPVGPYVVEGCELPDDVPPAVADLGEYFEEGAIASPALEFLSPVKGPALEQITVEVGSGIRSAADGAALYDQDVEKQAQQLGLEGW